MQDCVNLLVNERKNIMNKFIIIILLLLSLQIVCARNVLNEIKDESFKVHVYFPDKYNLTEEEKIYYDITSYVYNNLTVKIFWFPRTLNQIWKTREGDCSDRATLIKQMLKYRGIKSQVIHGFCDGVLHDSLLVYLKNETKDISEGYCNEIRYLGKGYW
jgi:hypothetical protein